MSTNMKRALSYLLGLFILSIGISFTIIARLGAGAWDALAVGLSNLTGFSVGTWVILIGVILIFVNALILKNRPQLISIVTVIILGYFIDFWLIIVFPNFFVETILIRFVILLIGVLLMGIGIATYLQGKFAIIPIDGFMMAIQNRLKVSLGVAKTIAEITALVFAFFAGGPIGIGTVIVTLSIGSMIQIFFPHLERFVHGYN
ncbi:YczE/YyaS/YitT family protein [Anaerobacillus isosaccharinicus]|uniref:YczE/YyaS/YitT family protein n=2 Tax=Anaerobacillus isosaccharinicus TaxID=1532552 RepID=A0A7S7LBD4_9BACI|nr:YitT family protein [Anaerobacillus isosaccharinicus]MBA5588644.1 YitT family protein [Anaerobacillus isosaccharinicus]QOY37948.1 YitT family protein [Anaerobacillus isosaccharinicus]